MNTMSNEIVLRPRFQLGILASKQEALEAFTKSEKQIFLVNCIDEHVFIKFNTENSHFWSPQLHLEIETIDENNSKLFGVFGPNPTLWTFFMFLHFGVAILFLVFAIWAYTNASLNKAYGLQLSLLLFAVILWLVFYVVGRAGKRKGKSQMKQLYQFVLDILKCNDPLIQELKTKNI